jgi:hypothetical protein
MHARLDAANVAKPLGPAPHLACAHHADARGSRHERAFGLHDDRRTA